MTTENYVYKKEVDWSLLHEGFTLPFDNQVVFGQIMGRFLKRGESKDITLYLNGKSYKAKITNVNFDPKFKRKKDTLQIRYSKNDELARALQAYFSKSYQFIKNTREMREPGDRTMIRLPDECKEYLAIYTTEYDDSYVLETIVADDILSLRQAVSGQKERVMEAKIVKRIYQEYLTGKTPDRIARLFKSEKVKNWDGKYNWQATSIDSMLRNEKYMGDTILQKSYTQDFLTKKRVVNDGKLQMYHIQDDHEAIIDIDTWNAVQQEIARREKYCEEHHTNAYAQLTETKPLSCKVICGECNHLYTRVHYTYRYGRKVAKWRCASTNKAGGARVCSNRYVLEEALIKLFIMSWNEIAGNYDEYKDFWKKNLKEGDELLCHKTKQIMAAAKRGKIKEMDGELMIMVMDYIKVFESGRLVIRFYDGTEFECETE